jgi:hypothetical protein
MLSPNVGQAFVCRPGDNLEMCHGGVPPTQPQIDSFASSCWPGGGAGGGAILQAAADAVRRWGFDGVDPFEVAISKAKSLGMGVFISYRLNDVHTLAFACHDGPYSDAFYRTHPPWRTGRDTLNFTFDPVREHRVDQITELIERYAMADGVELDFLRSPPFFNAISPESAGLMTDLEIEGSRSHRLQTR